MILKLSQVFSASLLAGFAVTLAGQAQASPLFATDVVYYNNNGTAFGERTDTSRALGSNESDPNRIDFMSLGLGGRAVFDFSQSFSGEISIWEATWGNPTKQSHYDESVKVYYGYFDDLTDWQPIANDLSQWSFAGDILNVADGARQAGGATNAGQAAAGIFSHVMLVDTSQNVARRDGFDVRAIAVNPVTEGETKEVPEPTSVLGLLVLGSVGIRKVFNRSTEA